jgi:hypothetical protein
MSDPHIPAQITGPASTLPVEEAKCLLNGRLALREFVKDRLGPILFRIRLTDLIAHSAYHLVKATAHRGVGKAELFLHSIQLSFRSYEELDKVPLLTSQLRKALRQELTVDGRSTLPTHKPFDIELITADRALAEHRIHQHTSRQHHGSSLTLF